MTDARPPFAPGWYPDPTIPAQLRYWDGVQWTPHVHPAPGAQPVAPAPAPAFAPPQPTAAAPRPKRRRGLVIGLVAAGTALALGATAFFVWGVPAITGPGLTTQDDWAYAYAPLQADLEIDHEFEFPADYDLSAMARENGDEFDTTFAFELFTDAALTRHADVRAYQFEAGRAIDVSPSALSTVRYRPPFVFGSSEPEREFDLNPGGGFFWGSQETFYLVQKLDRDGTELEKPIVHPFTVKRNLPTPEVAFSANENGTLQLSWEPVPEATEYLVTVSSWDGQRRNVDVVGVSEGTEWSPPVIDPFSGEVTETELEQNQGLQTYRLWSAADISDSAPGGTVDALDNDTTEYEYGVIATDGTDFSAQSSTDANAVAAALPKEIPFGTRDLQFPEGQWVDSLAQLPTRFYFTSLDGATRQTAAYIHPERYTVYEGSTSYRLEFSGKGTALAWPVRLDAPDEATVAAQIAEYNARVEAESPTTGMPQVTMIAAPVQADFDQFTPSTTAPDVDYPVWGSNDFTEYLAANLIAREDAIDVSDYLDRPGMPELHDALGEAVYQNPYVLGYRGYSVKGSVVYVYYANDAAETTRLQKEIASVVDAAVASATNDGMSDAEKATALNSWLADAAEYDKAALAASELSFGYPAGFEHAWDPSGVLLPENNNLGVCASYAAAYKALLDAAGVNNVVVTGQVLNGGGHAWNKVEIDGQWFAVDPTWNDGADRSRYLLITDSQFVDSAARTEDVDWMADLVIRDYATP